MIESTDQKPFAPNLLSFANARHGNLLDRTPFVYPHATTRRIPTTLILAKAALAEACIPEIVGGPVMAAANYVSGNSSWNFTRCLLDGTQQQSSAFRIVDCVIFHLDRSNPVGSAFLGPDGLFYLTFSGHRKLGGDAIVEKVANGLWSARLEMPNGSVWRLDLTRR